MYQYPDIADADDRARRVGHLLTVVPLLATTPEVGTLTEELVARNSANPIALPPTPAPTTHPAPVTTTTEPEFIPYEVSNRDWYEAIGEFVVTFEHTCQAARGVIILDVNTDNTHVSADKIVSLLAPMGARQLGDALTMILRRTGRIVPEDEKTLRRYVDLCDLRNTIVHGAWFIGWGNDPRGSLDPYNVTGMGPSKKPSDDQAWAVKRLSIQRVRDATKEAIKVKSGINRLMRYSLGRQL